MCACDLGNSCVPTPTYTWVYATGVRAHTHIDLGNTYTYVYIYKCLYITIRIYNYPYIYIYIYVHATGVSDGPSNKSQTGQSNPPHSPRLSVMLIRHVSSVMLMHAASSVMSIHHAPCVMHMTRHASCVMCCLGNQTWGSTWLGIKMSCKTC